MLGGVEVFVTGRLSHRKQGERVLFSFLVTVSHRIQQPLAGLAFIVIRLAAGQQGKQQIEASPVVAGFLEQALSSFRPISTLWVSLNSPSDCRDVLVRERFTQLDSRLGASKRVIIGWGLVRFQ